MTPANRDENGLTPTEVRIAVLVATAGIINPDVREKITEHMGYRHMQPVDVCIRAIRQKLDYCTIGELPDRLRQLGYANKETTLTLPTHADLVARMDAEIETYQAAKARISTLSLIDVFVVTRQVFPDAAFIAVDNTDQDDSGSLVASEEDVLDANGDILDTDNNIVLTWVDYVWGPLSNLDSSTQAIWQPFIVQDDNGWNMRLDLNAIELAAPELLAALTTQEG